MKYRFIVWGPLKGYRASVARAFDPAYKAFKELVRLLATVERVPYEVGDRTEVIVMIHWEKRARIDGSNILKAVEDGLYKQDRRLYAGSWSMVENDPNGERATITVKEGGD